MQNFLLKHDTVVREALLKYSKYWKSIETLECDRCLIDWSSELSNTTRKFTKCDYVVLNLAIQYYIEEHHPEMNFVHDFQLITK